MQILIFGKYACNPYRYYLYPDPHIFCESSRYQNFNPNLDIVLSSYTNVINNDLMHLRIWEISDFLFTIGSSEKMSTYLSLSIEFYNLIFI